MTLCIYVFLNTVKYIIKGLCEISTDNYFLFYNLLIILKFCVIYYLTIRERIYGNKFKFH